MKIHIQCCGSIASLLYLAACQANVPLEEEWLTCESNDQCVGVPSAYVYSAGSCDSAAINVAYLSDFESAYGDAKNQCLFIDRNDASCYDDEVECVDGRCALVAD